MAPRAILTLATSINTTIQTLNQTQIPYNFNFNSELLPLDQVKLKEAGSLSFKTISSTNLEVIVGKSTVSIKQGTEIEVKSNGVLFWKDNLNVNDFWSLELLESKATDVEVIRRILSFLPPLPPSKPSTRSFEPTQQTTVEPYSPTRPVSPTSHNLNSRITSNNTAFPQYRNSLVLIDEENNPVVVLPLSSPHYNHHNLHSNFKESSRGKELAYRVDEITNHLFGRDERRDNEMCRRKEELDNGHQNAQNGGLANESSTSNNQSASVDSGSDDSMSTAMLITNLPEEEGNKEEIFSNAADISHSSTTLTPTTSTNQLRNPNPSSITSTYSHSILSFATKGSIHYQDISEAETDNSNFETVIEESDSRRSSSATFETAWTSNGEGEMSRPTSTFSIQTIMAPVSTILREEETNSTNSEEEEEIEDITTPRQSHLSTTNSFIHPLSSSYTGTNSNAVLLEFLGHNSTITTRSITTHEINQQGLSIASVERDEKGGWISGLGEVLKDWSSWIGFGKWFNFEAVEKTKIDTLASDPVKRSRLSILYFDERGFGKKAYINGRIGA